MVLSVLLYENDMENDNELIKSFQNGDKASFDSLVRRHLSNTVGFFYTITRDKMAAEDLAQDVFFKLYKNLKKFRFKSTFTTYLYRINIDTANSWFTRNKWRKFLDLDNAINQIEEDKTLEKDWLAKELWDAISKLPTKQRSVVVMRIVEQLPYKKISSVTGMSEGTAKVNFHHALQTLKNVIS